MAEQLAELNKGDGFSYSTSEKWTGNYDTDGRKIYAKVVTGTTPNTPYSSMAHGISNFYKLKNVYGYIEQTGSALRSFIPIGFYNGTQYCSVFIDVTYVQFRIHELYYNMPFEITIEYTKQ